MKDISYSNPLLTLYGLMLAPILNLLKLPFGVLGNPSEKHLPLNKEPSKNPSKSRVLLHDPLGVHPAFEHRQGSGTSCQSFLGYPGEKVCFPWVLIKGA